MSEEQIKKLVLEENNLFISDPAFLVHQQGHCVQIYPHSQLNNGRIPANPLLQSQTVPDPVFPNRTSSDILSQTAKSSNCATNLPGIRCNIGYE